MGLIQKASIEKILGITNKIKQNKTPARIHFNRIDVIALVSCVSLTLVLSYITHSCVEIPHLDPSLTAIMASRRRSDNFKNMGRAKF